MSKPTREIELKLKIPDARTMAVLARLRRVGDFSLGPARVVRVEDAYYDTTAGDLQSAGWACRVRRGEKMQLALKSLSNDTGSIHDREELQEEIDSPEQRAWPASLRRRVDEHARGRALVVLFRIRQVRRQRIVSAEGRNLLELSLDSFRVVDYRGHRHRPHRTSRRSCSREPTRPACPFSPPASAGSSPWNPSP